MIPKICYHDCKNLDIDFKSNVFCYKYEDSNLALLCDTYSKSASNNKTANWILTKDSVNDRLSCSCCNRTYRVILTKGDIYSPSYCPNCFSKMVPYTV